QNPSTAPASSPCGAWSREATGGIGLRLDWGCSVSYAQVAATSGPRLGGSAMAMTRQGLEQFAEKERSRFEQLLKDFVEIPSVSADPDHRADLEQCTELGLSTVRAFGGRAEIHRILDGPPVVLGSFGSAKSRPTVTVYNHLDVVPASKATE